MGFSEDFLHFIWQFRLYGGQRLLTAGGEVLRILTPGVLNKNAGPDFLNAKILLDGTVWAGNVEIHLKASDWFVHQHQHNRAYENVILHVVYTADAEVYRDDGSLIPVLVLKGLVPSYFFDKYELLVGSVHHFPCEKQIGGVEPFVVRNFLTRLVIERLLEKAADVVETLDELKGDWEATFYRFLARSFGFKVNAEPMEILARSIPFHLFAKHGEQSVQVEALIFGQAGFLNQRFVEDYPRRLKEEYLFLKRKYGLQPMDVSLWKFMRMRPQNFPTIRLAQFAALLLAGDHLFARLTGFESVERLTTYFEHLPVNEFWRHHYHFNREAAHVNLQMGIDAIHHVFINSVSLFLFVYGQKTDQEFLINKGIDLLEGIPPEKNAIVRQFLAAGVKVDSAFASQGILQLKKKYCNEKKCLSCGIGVQILKQ